MCPRIPNCQSCYNDSLLMILDQSDLKLSIPFSPEEIEVFRYSWCSHQNCLACKATMHIPTPTLRKYIVTFTQDGSDEINYQRLVKVYNHFLNKHTILRYTFELTKKGNPHLHMQIATTQYLTKNITQYRKLNKCIQIDIQLQKGTDNHVIDYFKKDNSLKEKMLEYNIEHQKL